MISIVSYAVSGEKNGLFDRPTSFQNVYSSHSQYEDDIDIDKLHIQLKFLNISSMNNARTVTLGDFKYVCNLD